MILTPSSAKDIINQSINQSINQLYLSTVVIKAKAYGAVQYMLEK